MKSHPTNPSYGAWVAAVLALLLLALGMSLGLWYLWRPQHIVWARNGYGMAAVGAWSGWDGFLAFLLFWFFELKGRTLVTVLSIAFWVVCAWFVFGRLLTAQGADR